MLSLRQARALLGCATQLKLERRWATQVTKVYREMLVAVASHHRLPEVKLLEALRPPQEAKSQPNRNDKPPAGQLQRLPMTTKEKGGSATPAKSASKTVTLPTSHLTPYQIKQAQVEEQRLKRRAQEAEMQKKRAAWEQRQLQQEVLREKQRRERRIAQQERTTRRTREQNLQQQTYAQREAQRIRMEQSAHWEAVRQVRVNDARTSHLYPNVPLSAVVLPERFGPIKTGPARAWLLNRLELEVGSEVGPLFVPLAALLGGDAELCRCLQSAHLAMTEAERLTLLHYCLASTTLRTTPAVLDLLEALYNCIEARGEAGTHLPDFHRQLQWRKRRCAETYGYGAQELAAETTQRSEALRRKATLAEQTVPGARPQARMEVPRPEEWGSEWDSQGFGFTRYNPFDYK